MVAGVQQFETILYDKRGPRATITFNRPERRNATNTQLYEELLAAAQDADRDPDIRVVILTGAGPVFSSGQDQRHTSEADVAAYARYGRANRTARTFLRTMSRPVIGRINGPAAGGGSLLALTACDITIASTTARFALREVNTSVPGPAALIYSAGRARALFMALTGAWISAEQAEDWGLIYKAVAPEQLDDEVDTVAAMLEDLPPLAVAATKEQMNLVLAEMGVDQMLRYAEAQSKYLHTTEDRKEAQRAFIEKRKPVYKGR